MKLYSYKKGGGAEKVLAIVVGGAKSVHPLKGLLPCLEAGGGRKKFGPTIFPFCSPPPP